MDNTTSILTSPITPGSVVKGASMLVGYNTGAVQIGEYMVDECIKVAGAPEKCSSATSRVELMILLLLLKVVTSISLKLLFVLMDKSILVV